MLNCQSFSPYCFECLVTSILGELV